MLGRLAAYPRCSADEGRTAGERRSAARSCGRSVNRVAGLLMVGLGEMRVTYKSGLQVKAGDHVRYGGEPGEVEFVGDPEAPTPETTWYLQTLGPGAMIREPKVSGSVYVRETDKDHLLEFVSRAERG